MGLNKFADLTAEEFKALYASGYRAQEKRSKNVNLSLLHSNANPASVDWSTKGACRACAVSAAAAARAPLLRADAPRPCLPSPASPSLHAPLTRHPVHLPPALPPSLLPRPLPRQAP
jgi:hypothetical protein